METQHNQQPKSKNFSEAVKKEAEKKAAAKDKTIVRK